MTSLARHCIKPKFLGLLTCLTLLAGCASKGPLPDALTTLCAQRDLSQTSQRLALAAGYHALARKDLICAERMSLDARSKDLQDPYAALNLGAVYQRLGRLEQARDLYRTVMQLDGAEQTSSGELSHLATQEQHLNQRPAQIARHNLALMQR